MALDANTLEALQVPAGFTSPFLGQSDAHLYNGAYRGEGAFNLGRLCNALTIFGVDSVYQFNVFEVLASILHLGNLEFIQQPGNQRVRVANPEILAVVCQLWGVESDAIELAASRLEQLLTSKPIRDTRSFLTTSQCKHATFALAKGLYEALFEYLVGIVRRTLSCTGAGDNFDEDSE